tara:strand:- start:84 stop:785 length:702 start_codon:yes stop_codon:yes gene_type:complete
MSLFTGSQVIRDRSRNQKDLFDLLMHSRYPVRTNFCHTINNQLHHSPPLTLDLSTSESHLRNLVARWNKCVYGNDTLDQNAAHFQELCQDWQYLKQNVHNPRIRLWGTAVAYVLQSTKFDIPHTNLAELVNLGNGNFKARFRRTPTQTRPQQYVDIFTATTGTESPQCSAVKRNNEFNWMGKHPTAYAYYVKVTMTNKDMQNTKDYDIPDFEVSDTNHVVASVTFTKFLRNSA